MACGGGEGHGAGSGAPSRMHRKFQEWRSLTFECVEVLPPDKHLMFLFFGLLP